MRRKLQEARKRQFELANESKELEDAGEQVKKLEEELAGLKSKFNAA